MHKLLTILTCVVMALLLSQLVAASDGSGNDNNANEAIVTKDIENSDNNNNMILGDDCPPVPPVANCPGDTSVFLCELGPVDIPGFSWSDPDNNIEGITVSPGTLTGNTVTFTPNGEGEYTITMIVTDESGLADTCETVVTVMLNSAPTCTMPQPDVIQICSPIEICLPYTAEDVDNNLAGCEVIAGSGEVVNGNWCYTPAASGYVSATIRCEDECGAYCEGLIEVEFIIEPDWAVIVVDRTGSMALVNTIGQSRLERAVAQAHIEVDKLLDPGDADYPGVFEVAVMRFNSSSGIELVTDFVNDAMILHDAINAIVNPRHDTPLAAAMCQAHCTLPDIPGECVKYVITFTDGQENVSQNFDICDICEPCDEYVGTGWNYDCDPGNPASCTDWQLCLADVFANSGVNLMHYFGEPINPFVKGNIDGLEDIYFLKYTAETSQGSFTYYSDNDYLCADVNADLTVNVSDAVFLINYVFVLGSPAPDPILIGDANWDGSVNISDAVLIMGYIFAGLPAPTCAH